MAVRKARFAGSVETKGCVIQLDVVKMFGSGNGIHQRADSVYAYPDLVRSLQREGIGRNDTGACEQEAAIRETVVAEKIFD